MGHSRRTSNYLELMLLSTPTHTMSMIDPIAISIKTPRIDSECSLEKEFIELICKNLWIVLYLAIYQAYSFHSCVCGPLT